MKNILLILLCIPFFGISQIDYELEFNSATQDYVEMSNASAVIANKTAFSISCWVNPQTNTTHSGIMGFRNNTDADFYLLQLQNTNNVEARFRNSSGINYDITANNLLDFNQWQHLVFTYDGNNIHLYKDGVLISSTPASGMITQSAQSFRLAGLDFQTDVFHMNGRLDEVRLWDVALSQTEINNWMCISIDPTHPNYNNLMGYWPLNEGTGITTTDLSTNGNNGTLMGGIQWQTSTSCFGSSSQVLTYVPDDNFENYLEANAMGNGIANDDYVMTANIDTVTFLNVNNQNIADLTGIEDFTALDSLYCEYNQITSLDVSNNTSLFNMRCGYNQLITLDVSQNQNLKFLYCEDNQIASLDLSGAVNLQDIYCEYNQLTSLDVSNNILLKWLMCYQNQIGLLDISNLTILSDFDCSYNNISSLDISNNIQLIALDCHDNNLTLLDMRNGNNQNMDINTSNNINLTCISVDDSTWSNTNWTAANGNIDTQHYFSFDCAFIPSSWNCINNACVDPLDGSGFFSDSLSCMSSCIQTEISDQINNSKQELIRIIDVLGRETKDTKNEPLFYLYDDGTVEKRIVIE
tara:strand:+ start:112 stop:1851 length:1740 start_codon:yes stop_codon:yes gene_type:complete